MTPPLRAQHGVRLQKLTPAQCAAIHQASLRLLETVGIEVHHDEARALLAAAGARVEDTRVRVPAHLVAHALAVVPHSFILHDRSGEPVMDVGADRVYFGAGSETPSLLDHRTGERRPGTLADVAEGVRLLDALPHLDFVMSLFVPWDLAPRVAYLEQFKAMLRHTTKPLLFLSPSGEDIRAMVAMLEAVAGGEAALRERPRGLCHINVTHPLRHEQGEVDKLLFLARKGVPCTYCPVVFRGSNGPVTQAGAMAVAGAGELLGLVLGQTAREGSPIALPGGTADKLDLRSMIDVYSAPEKRVAFTEMARYYQIPHFGLAGASDSKTVDEQAAAEASLSLLVEALAGSNLIHDVGYMESGMSNSLAQLVILDEVIGWIRRFMAPLVVDDETLALDWYPGLFDQSSHDKWVKAGSLRLGEKAARRVDELLASHEVADLAPEILATIDALIAARAAQAS